MSKTLLAVFFHLFVLFLSISAQAATPTQAQIEAFKALSPAQQAALMNQYGGSSVKGGVGGKETLAPETAVVTREVWGEENRQRNKVILREDSRLGDEKLEIEAKQEVAKREVLKPYGYEIFAGETTSFAPVTDIPIPANYIIGPGDSVRLYLYGVKNEQYELMVSRRGEIQLPEIGSMVVAGISYNELKKELTAKIQRQMVGVNVNISMGELRSMRVFLLGNVYRPGSYTVSALSTISSSLYAGGGLNTSGSLRDIQLKRAGKVVSRFDLYDLLLQGDTSDDSRLQPGDTLFVPPVGKMIGIAGEVVRPALYEVKKGEENLGQLLEFAGGLLPTAYRQRVIIERISANGDRILLDVNLDQGGEQEKLKAGDMVRVDPVLERLDNVVAVDGFVARP
ncbi:MAG: SLBB domain-containing protein, partial [Gammaproteobacteria bacterium]|nr:SLBB domain-containing protein [Gammaproteobacteria bacterium]